MTPAFAFEVKMKDIKTLKEELDEAVRKFDNTCQEVVMKQQSSTLDPRVKNLEKATALMDFLGIPQQKDGWSRWTEVHAVDLYDIFMDEEKFNALATKLRMKAFW